MNRCALYGHDWHWRGAIRRFICWRCFRIDG